jgi:heme/copper-type cytochrome/quinol oxidase subunit 2
MLYPAPLDVTPPTVAIWTTLQNYYLLFGGAAAAIVIGYMVYMIVKNRERPGRQVPAFHEEEAYWGNWKGIVMLLFVTGSVLAFVEYETFASANLITIPNSPNTLNVGRAPP